LESAEEVKTVPKNSLYNSKETLPVETKTVIKLKKKPAVETHPMNHAMK
jgi:hypothetical protein